MDNKGRFGFRRMEDTAAGKQREREREREREKMRRKTTQTEKKQKPGRRLFLGETSHPPKPPNK